MAVGFSALRLLEAQAFSLPSVFTAENVGSLLSAWPVPSPAQQSWNVIP